MNEEFEKLEKFFELNLKLKDFILKVQPEALNFGHEFYIEYVDKVIDGLKKVEEIFYYFVDYTGMNPFVKDIIREKFNILRKTFIDCDKEYIELRKAYEKAIYSMTPGIDKSLGKNFYGYKGDRKEMAVFDELNTVNDMLHAFHFYLINNEDFYDKMPIIDKKTESEYEHEINLCGIDNELARDLFDNFPKEIVTLRTDILSFEDTILIMARDLGHALTIEVQKEDDHLRVRYFIPKVCNVEMVNQLKGVTKLKPEISDMFSSTTGEFVVNESDFVSEMVDFLKSVPTDVDMIIETPKLA